MKSNNVSNLFAFSFFGDDVSLPAHFIQIPPRFGTASRTMGWTNFWILIQNLMYLETRYFRLISYLLHENWSWSNTLWKEIPMKIKNATSKHSPPHCATVPRQKPNGSDFFVKGLLFCVVRCHMTTALLVFFRPPMADGMGGHY